MRSRASLGIALLVLALGCASCGGSTTSTSSAVQLVVSTLRHSCPSSDIAPRRVLAKSATRVLVPGHPTGLLICRYTSLENIGRPGSLAGGLSVVRPDAISRLASEFDALPPLTHGRNCPTFGGRSELFIFRYQGASTERVLLRMEGCIPVTNGRVVRDGLGLHFAGGEAHWPDESLL